MKNLKSMDYSLHPSRNHSLKTVINDPGHVGIISGPNARIDNNGSPADAENFNGPTVRGLDDGDYLSAAPYQPKSYTLPAARGGNQSNGFPKSLLQELDEE